MLKEILRKRLLKKEKNLLKKGLCYREISEITKNTINSISIRNHMIHHIDLHKSFRKRFSNGKNIPNKLLINDSFGYWFSGLFDGDGHFAIRHEQRKDKRYTNIHIGIQIKLREDDEQVINYIMKNLNVGNKQKIKSYKTSRPSVAFCVFKINDLAEIFIPLFNKYKLQSKKKKEFQTWEKIVKEKYCISCGGRTINSIPKKFIKKWADDIDNIRKLRKYQIL
jgi:hypothetical protein